MSPIASIHMFPRGYTKHYYAGVERVCAAQPIQHLQYLPFGEEYISEHTASPYTERFTFTGKERDEETGFGYFGARYMDNELTTMWLSVDPMADKYPSMSPYNYCAWNPVKLIDPDGEDTIFSFATATNNSKQNASNNNILKYLRSQGNIPGVTSIGMHGTKEGKMEMSADNGKGTHYIDEPTLRLYMSPQMPVFDAPDFNKAKEDNESPIFILYSCYTGDGSNPIGMQLSKNTNGIVVAPGGILCVNSTGQQYIEDKSGSDGGSWNVFYNGQLVTSFSGKISPKDWVSSQGGVSGLRNVVSAVASNNTSN